MAISFKHNNKQYLNFDLDSDEWGALDIPEADKIAIIKKAQLDEVLKLREAAYKVEADPLYMAWQFDQTPEAEQAWRAKVEEIKARYPKPVA